MFSIKGFTDYAASFQFVQKAGQALNSLKCWKKEKEDLSEVDLEAERQYSQSIRARDLYRAGNRDEAMALLDAEAGANNLYALSRRATILLEEGRYDDALADAMDVLALCPVNGGRKAECLYVAGKIFLHENDPERALLYFKHAATFDPDWLRIHEGIAQAELALGNFDASLKAANQLLQSQRTQFFDKGWEIQGLAYLGKGNVEKALFCFEKMSGDSKEKLISDALASINA